MQKKNNKIIGINFVLKDVILKLKNLSQWHKKISRNMFNCKFSANLIAMHSFKSVIQLEILNEKKKVCRCLAKILTGRTYKSNKNIS